MTTPFLEECLAVLKRAPDTFDALLRDLPDAWTEDDDGPGTWSPYVVIGHLIHGEKVDWIPRLEIILQYGTDRPFESFDREGQFQDRQRQPLPSLLDEFRALRRESLERLGAMDLQPQQLETQGLHPALGIVTVRQLLATWTAHDLGHLVQVSRTMARRYRQAVGPWAEYLSAMK